MILLLACTDPVDTAVEALDSPVESAPPEDPGLESPAPAEDLDDADEVLHARFVFEDYAYNGQVPGPTLRARLGDTLTVDLENASEVDTTIHWHGLAVPFAMDGVTWQSDPVGPGEAFRYTFTLNQAGTFWYHPHFDTDQQVDRGAYGLLVVEDPEEPRPDREVLVALDIPDEYSEDTVHVHGHHAGGGRWTANGLSAPELPVQAGETVLVRVVNTSSVGYVALSGVRVVGSDQGLLPGPVDEALLGPGDRAALEFLPGSEPIEVRSGSHSLAGAGMEHHDQVLFTLVPEGDAAAADPLPFAFGGETPSADPGTTDVLYTFQGGEHTGEWAINGEQFPEVTVETLGLGGTWVIEVRNLSPTEHPFHLHGLEFEVLSVDGVAPAHRTVADTFNVPVRAAVRLLVEADNPGDWMTHCHILPHAHGGMMTVLRVE